jgi:hypothetical protein
MKEDRRRSRGWNRRESEERRMFGGLQGKRAAVAAVGVASALFTVSIAAPALGGPNAFKSAAGAVSTAKKALKIAKRAEKAAKSKAGRGPQGPVGPAGPAGPAGPPGASTAITRGTIDTPVIIASTAVQSLSLPAGNWVVMAHVDGAHNGTTASTRMECQLVDAGGGLMDYAKMRAQANAGAEPMVFVSLGLHGTATLSAPGTVRTNCGSTNGTSFTLTTAKMTAVQVGSIVVQ